MIERFLPSKQLDKHDAHFITIDHILPTLRDLKISAMLIGLGADGASVMCGKQNGVYTKVKMKYPSFLYVHCACHRFNLVMCQFIKQIPKGSIMLSLYKNLHQILTPAKIEIYLREHRF